MKPLLVIVPDRISDVLAKGEYQPRYYNPGNYFDEVHILICNDDKPDPGAVQRTVGSARLVLHNLPEDTYHFIQRRRIFQPWLLRPWAKPLRVLLNWYQFRLLDDWAQPAVELARQIQPALIRCHGNDYNAYVASRIKQTLGIPYVVSLHINPDINPRRRVLHTNAAWDQKLFALFFDEIEKAGLRGADLVLPVYRPIIPYLKRIGCANFQVAYNVLSDRLLEKDDYTLHRPVRLISVGRHFQLKNPANIILALRDLPDVCLTLVGDGPLQGDLQALVAQNNLSDRVIFRPAIPNDELCRLLPEQDIFVIHSEHWEISKSVLEALLTGLPVVLNRRLGGDAPELQEDFITFVENTPQGYRIALQELIENHVLRETVGRQTYKNAQANWSPGKTETKYVEIYQRLMVRDDMVDGQN
jgi:glycosyltransferase involved in cell wall biosynthesis